MQKKQNTYEAPTHWFGSIYFQQLPDRIDPGHSPPACTPPLAPFSYLSSLVSCYLLLLTAYRPCDPTVNLDNIYSLS